MTGKSYSDAAAKISGWNGEAVIATVTGNQLEMGDCIVTSWQKSMFLDSLGEDSRSNEYLLHLNCKHVDEWLGFFQLSQLDHGLDGVWDT